MMNAAGTRLTAQETRAIWQVARDKIADPVWCAAQQKPRDPLPLVPSAQSHLLDRATGQAIYAVVGYEPVDAFATQKQVTQAFIAVTDAQVLSDMFDNAQDVRAWIPLLDAAIRTIPEASA